ncbi:hypothetical protein Tco_0313096 [Tanacetum coccineum]
MLQPFSTAELIQEFCSYFKDLDSPKDDLVIVMIDSDKDMDDEVHATENVETGDTSVPKSLFPRSSQVQELTNQKIDEEAKAKAAKHESEVRKEELIDLLSPEVVNKYYNDKLQYDRYYDKMLNRRAVSRITNYDVLTRKGPITLKVYIEDGTSEIIPNFKACDLHLGDPLDKLNDLANKKRKHVDDIHDYFKANKRLKPSVQYKDHLPGTVVNEPVLGLDDHARTFSSLLLAKIDKRNLNPLKQMRVIKQLRQ